MALFSRRRACTTRVRSERPFVVICLMPIEIRLNSTNPARPNDELLKQILTLAGTGDLAKFLQEEEPKVESAAIEPQAGFPTGLEPFVIAVAIAFGTGLATGFSKGVGAKVGEAMGEEAGKRIGARIRVRIQTRFPDVNVDEDSEE